MKKKIGMLIGNSNSSIIMYNFLSKHFEIDFVIKEKPVKKSYFIKKRIRSLGFITVFGQILFQFIILKILNFISKKRVEKILKINKLSLKEIDSNILINVDSVNSDKTLNILKKKEPEIIVVNGTRIISKTILSKIKSKFLNTHVGITPKYRGVHGGYWSLVNNDPENFGVTVHLVDTGIDTGKIIYQRKVNFSYMDNFITYPYLQISEGVKIMKKSINDILNNNLILKTNTMDSKIWSHPTIWYYLFKLIFYRIK